MTKRRSTRRSLLLRGAVVSRPRPSTVQLSRELQRLRPNALCVKQALTRLPLVNTRRSIGGRERRERYKMTSNNKNIVGQSHYKPVVIKERQKLLRNLSKCAEKEKRKENPFAPTKREDDDTYAVERTAFSPKNNLHS